MSVFPVAETPVCDSRTVALLTGGCPDILLLAREQIAMASRKIYLIS
jgi:hypothetical protein